MTKIVRVHDKEFELFLSAERIQSRVAAIAAEMNAELRELNPVFLAILNGSFFFTADLLRELSFPCEVSFVKVSSYRGDRSGGEVNMLIGLDERLTGRHIVVLEDIVDSGLTMKELISQLSQINPASLRVATLLLKREALKHEVQLDYIGFEVPDRFIIGYGLDYDKYGRNYGDIYILKANHRI